MGLELIEKMKEYIDNADDSNWWLLQIQQKDNMTTGLIKQWRVLMNSSCSIGGISNRNWIRRYINGAAFWLNYTDGKTDNLLVFFQSSKSNIKDSGFVRHLVIRHYHSTKKRANMTLDQLKPTKDKTLFQSMNEIISNQLNVVFENGDVPVVRVCKFGKMFGRGVKLNNPE